MDPLTLVVLTVIVGLFFDFCNGWNDSANAIATVVSTRVLSPAKALLWSAFLNFVGAGAFNFFLAKVGLELTAKVAKTMGSGVVTLEVGPSSVVIVMAAMIGASAWVLWCTRLGLPISCSHALVGGLIGATIFATGFDAVVWSDLAGSKPRGVLWILVALMVSPVVGMIAGYVLVAISVWLARRATPRQGHRVFGVLQLFSASFMAFEHGRNDAQKVMGVIALTLFVGGYLVKDGVPITDIGDLYIPLWVIVACAAAMGIGTAVGGWRVIRTLGTKLARITTTEGFAAETGAGMVLEAAASLGIPVSTTHTITGGIFGVGSARGVRAVKWGIGAKIVYAWLFTLPAAIVMGGVLSWLAHATSALVMVLSVAAVTVLVWVVPRLRRRSAA